MTAANHAAASTESHLASPSVFMILGSEPSALHTPRKYSNAEPSSQPALNLLTFLFSTVAYLIVIN